MIKISLNYALQALYHFNGDVTDSSGNGNDGTNNGVTFTTDKLGNSNSAGSFNGTDADVRLGTSSNFEPSSKNLSVFCYINTNDTATTQGIFTKVDNNNNTGYQLYLHNDNRLILRMGDNGWNIILESSTAVFNTNTWYQVGFTYDGNEAKIFIDKEEVGSATGSFAYASSSEAVIGGRDANDLYFNGEIDEVRFYTRALTQYEIDQLYYAYDTDKNQVGILNEGLIAAHHFSNDLTDWTGNSHNFTNSGTSFTADKNGNSSSAIDTSGSGANHLENTSSIGNELGSTNRFAFSIWYKGDGTSWSNEGLFELGYVEDGNGAVIIRSGNTNELQFRYDAGSIAEYIITDVNDGNWHLFTVSANGNEVTIMNDKEIIKTYTNSATLNFSSKGMVLGSYYRKNDSALNFKGFIDEPRFYDRPINFIEHLMLYKGYDSEQNSQDTFDMDLVAYYPFTEDYTDASGNGNDGTNNGTTLTTDKNGVSNQAIELNGTTDYVQLPYFDLGSQNFSTLAHINLDANDGVILSNNLSGNQAEIYFHVNSSSQLRADGGGFSSAIASNETLNNTQWYSVGFSRDNSDGVLYIDGNEYIRSSVMSDYTEVEDYEIGYNQQGNNQYLNGTLDEKRIYQRTVYQDEHIEYTYGYDQPTMLDDDLVGGTTVEKTDALFFSGGF